MRCNICGRFNKQIKEAMGLPLSTGFPPDKPNTASTVPYVPFVCYNHQVGSCNFGRVEYYPIGFEWEK